MYMLINTSTGKSSTVTYEKLNKLTGDDLDAAFFTEAFTDHTLDTESGKLLVLEVEK